MKSRGLRDLIELAPLLEHSHRQSGFCQYQSAYQPYRPCTNYQHIRFFHFYYLLTNGLAITSSVEIQTLFTSKYWRMPSIPHSRPIPLILNPPNGEVTLVER